MYLGFAGYFSVRLCNEPERAEKLAKLLLDRRWPWPLTSVVFGLRAGWTKHARRLKLSGAQGILRLRDGITDPENRDASIDHRADADENHAKLHVTTGQRLANPDSANAASISGVTKASDLLEGAELLSWLEVMHEIMIVVDAGNAVLTVWPTHHMANSDATFVRIVLDTSKAVFTMGVHGNVELQNTRANYWRPELGDKYIRHPRWGNYLRREHLDRVGGLARVRDAVPLAKVLELGGPGDLVYLQCTEHPAGALTPEGEQVRQALEDVLAPIVAPPRPQELTTS